MTFPAFASAPELAKDCKMSKENKVAIPFSHIESLRGWLFVLAASQVSVKLRRKLEPDDIVQETLTRAHHAITNGSGPTDEHVVKPWLIQIVKNVLIDQWKHFTADKRDIGREHSVMAQLEHSAAGIDAYVVANQTSPSMAAARNEQMAKLAQALQLLPDDIREVVIQKHINNKSLQAIAEMTGNSLPSVAGLLRRGLEKLRKNLS